MENNEIEVSVIIPTYHDWESLKSCVDAINNQTLSADKYEVIIVNNDPEDTLPENFFLPKGFKIINEEKPGSYAARNAALGIAKGEIIAFTDSDCIPDPDWLLSGAKYLKSGTDRVAGRVDLFYRSNRLSWAEVYEKAFAFRQKKNVENGVSVTANFFTWRATLNEVGQFDASLMSGGDFEWNRRASAKGKSIVYGESCTVHHPARSTLDDLIGKKKRTSGGVYRRDGFKSRRFFRGFIPPIKTLYRLVKNRRLNGREVVVAILLYHYLHIYEVYFFMRLFFDLDKPNRS